MTPERATAVTALRALLALAILVILSLVAVVAFPGLVGGDDAFFVTSDSMQPAVESGDVVVTTATPPAAIRAGDVVTVRTEDAGEPSFVTHRVVDVEVQDGTHYFKLKGDANDEPDPGYARASDVVGTSHLHLPAVGHLFAFARSGPGLLTLVVLPGLGLALSGGWGLLRELRRPSTAPDPEGER